MSKKEYAIELVMPAVMAVIAVIIILTSYDMGSEGVFPRLIAYLLLIGVAVTVGETVVKKQKTVDFKNLRVWRVAVLLAVTVVYILLLNRIGYFVDTFLLAVITMLLLGYRSWWKMGLSSLAAVTFVFIIFKVILKVPLPLLFLDF